MVDSEYKVTRTSPADNPIPAPVGGNRPRSAPELSAVTPERFCEHRSKLVNRIGIESRYRIAIESKTETTPRAGPDWHRERDRNGIESEAETETESGTGSRLRVKLERHRERDRTGIKSEAETETESGTGSRLRVKLERHRERDRTGIDSEAETEIESETGSRLRVKLDRHRERDRTDIESENRDRIRTKKEKVESKAEGKHAFKLFKGYRGRKSGKGNKVSPALVRSPSYSGTVDARSEIDMQGFCFYRGSLPAPPRVPAYENASYDSRDSSSGSLERYATRSSDSGFDGSGTADSGCRGSGYGSGCSDSAYDSVHSSPARPRPVRIATVSYFNVNDSEDSSSVRTECTLLEYEHEELDAGAQNALNESLELVSSL
ncbi:hypothetical protein EVAR_80436_1 [Eumeta japonica]|uniref:Uncharacterized protein n=1 Tax=Eumeta variegata TaxID=151549 RepID=A0A4C1VI28_EUMVA|nr:hypothetical protein EVAR_80436_1 [Eumeta japonica]